MNVRSLAAASVLVLVAGLLQPVAAHAATSATFTPRTILAPGLPTAEEGGGVDQNVTPVGTISLTMTASQSAYVVSTMRVNSATIRSLFDNEDVTLYTRFLIHPGVAGTVTCTANVRGNSLSNDDAMYRLVSGYIQFADTSVVNNPLNGAPVQGSVSAGVHRLNAGTPVQRLPALDDFTMPAGVTNLNVVGDVELMVSVPSTPCDRYQSAQVKFTLFINQWKSDGTLCKTDASIQVTHDVPYWVHHMSHAFVLPS